MGANIDEGVIKWVSQQTGIDRSKIFIQSSIANDLGVDGNDAVEFAGQYARVFNVDMAAFSFDDYFNKEMAWNPIALIMLFCPRKPKKELRLLELIAFAKSGKWGTGHSETPPNTP